MPSTRLRAGGSALHKTNYTAPALRELTAERAVCSWARAPGASCARVGRAYASTRGLMIESGAKREPV